MKIILTGPIIPRGDRGAMALPDFGRSANSISTKGGHRGGGGRGADYVPQIIMTPLDFLTFLGPLHTDIEIEILRWLEILFY